MPESSQPRILCAVRGRPESRSTVARAIDLALSTTDARLTFFMVMDLEFLAQATPTMSPPRVVYRRLLEMGQFTLMILCDRAKNRGVKDVDYIVRSGNVREELQKLIDETKIQVLVLGRPVGRPASDVFSPQEFESFTAQLEEEAGLQVVKVDSDPDDHPLTWD